MWLSMSSTILNRNEAIKDLDYLAFAKPPAGSSEHVQYGDQMDKVEKQIRYIKERLTPDEFREAVENSSRFESFDKKLTIKYGSGNGVVWYLDDISRAA